MSADRDTTRIVRSWLEEGVTVLPDRVLDAVLDQLPATPQRRSPWATRRSPEMNHALRIALAMAAVLVVAFVGYQLLPVANVGPPRPTAAATPSPSPTDRPVPSEGALPAGSYVLTTIEPLRVTFTVPAGGWQKNPVPDTIWTSNSEGRFSFAVVENLFADPCDTTSLHSPPIGPSVDDLATALANLPGITAIGPTDVALGGYEGKLVEISLPATAAPCGEDGASLWPIESIGEAAPLEEGARTRFWILDVDGTRLVVVAVERDGLQTVWRNELQSIIDSIRIELR